MVLPASLTTDPSRSFRLWLAAQPLNTHHVGRGTVLHATRRAILNRSLLATCCEEWVTIVKHEVTPAAAILDADVLEDVARDMWREFERWRKEVM
jgi:hypothetical protein